MSNRTFENIEIQDRVDPTRKLSLMIQTPKYVEFRGTSSPQYSDGLLYCRLLMDQNWHQYIQQLCSGAYIVLLTQALAEGQFSGPTPKAYLPPLTIERVEYHNNIPRKIKRTFKSLEEAGRDIYASMLMTECSLDIYAQYFRRRGAMIGRWVGNQIQWERDTTKQPQAMVN